MEKKEKIIYFTFAIVSIIFLGYFLFENFFTLNFLSDKWQETTFLHEFTLADFNFFSRLVKRLMVVTSFYRIDYQQILSVIIYAFRAIGIVEALFLIFGLFLFYCRYIIGYIKLKLFDTIYSLILLIFSIKIASASLALLYSQYQMTISFSSAISIMKYTLYFVIVFEILMITWIIWSAYKEIKVNRQT